ncbi:DinB/UmuC family translesion DNA polymerase, partial [Nonomuraea sp. LPB2021202275-12-8]
TRTRQTTLAAPTTDPAALTHAALIALGRFELTRPVRLLGVAVTYEMPA